MASQPGEQVCDLGWFKCLRERRHRRRRQAAHAQDVFSQHHLLHPAGLNEREAGRAVAFQKPDHRAAITRLHKSRFVAGPDALAWHEDFPQQRFLSHAELAEQVRTDFLAFISNAMTTRAGLQKQVVPPL